MREKLREWCIEKAIQLLVTPNKAGLVEDFTDDDVIAIAKKLEQYIIASI